MLAVGMFVVLLVAVIVGANMVHKAVCALRDDVAKARHDLLQELERRR